jgi:cleavage and polyadenylation specificity factor subunit 3
VVTQRQSLKYVHPAPALALTLTQLAKSITKTSNTSFRVFSAIDVTLDETTKILTIEWTASPINDLYADAVLTAVLQNAPAQPPGINIDSSQQHFKECFVDTIQVSTTFF